MSRTTILAARRVEPPDLMVPAEASAPRMNETGPDAVPPEVSSSFDDRRLDRLMPAPEPALKIRPSSTYQLRMECMSSSTSRMKHAETLGGSTRPTLNHTGELNAIFCISRRWVSSARKVSSASPATYPSLAPRPTYQPTTRLIMSLTDRSRRGQAMGPRKYFWATMLVAFCDQAFGNSTAFCSKATLSP